MANSITTFKKYVPLLDEVYTQASVTAVLDGSAELAREGANAGELIIPKISMNGLGAYSRASGYAAGDVTLQNETVACNFDRGRMFSVDSLDDAETAGVAFGRLSGEFIRTKVAPELDAFRFATYAQATGVGAATPAALSTGDGVITALRAAVKAMDDAQVPYENRYLFMNGGLLALVEDMETTKSRAVLTRFQQIIPVPDTRFYTKITQNDGVTSGQEAGGYAKATGGKALNFIVIHKDAVIQFSKHVAPKVIAPENNPDADAWKFGYRCVGIAEVYENKAAGIYVHAAA